MFLLRHRREGEYDPRFNSAGHGLMPASEMNSNILWKQVFYGNTYFFFFGHLSFNGMLVISAQNLIIKVREHEEEISQLRKHLADYSMKVVKHTEKLMPLN